MDGEFQQGYNKALKDLKEKLKIKGINIDEVLNEMHEERRQVAPSIYFTKLNKKGELEYDREKTLYFANHPEELDVYFASQKAAQSKPQKQKEPQFTLLKPSDSRYKKVLTGIIGHKTEEMCSAENKLLYGDVDVKAFEGKSPLYLNALGNQIMYLTQNPLGFEAVCKACDVKDTEVDAIDQILNKCVPEEALFIGK